MTFAAAVPFYYGARPASGAWCTMMRVNENLAGAWPTQQEALWFHGGNLQQSRFFSLQLALQIKARAAGITTPVYGLQPVYHRR